MALRTGEEKTKTAQEVRDADGRLSVTVDTAGSRTLKYAPISCSSSGNNEIVAAVTSKRIVVVGYTLLASAAVNAKWRTANTDISGLLYLAANGGAAPQGQPAAPLFRTAAGEALNLNLSGAIAVGGHLTYYEE